MKKGILIGFILGLIVMGTTAYAAYKYKANEVEYTPENENWKVDNVDIAIKELYKRVSNIELELGETYSMGGYEWIAAEELDGGYVMQSTGMTSGAWPGYKLTGNYEGTKSYGNADTNYLNSIDGDNIANYDEKTLAFYDVWKNRELATATYGKGLYLVNAAKCGVSSSGELGTGNYVEALKIASSRRSSGIYQAVLGDALGSRNNGYPWYVEADGYVKVGGPPANFYVTIAPAFNLDASKVYLYGTTIKKK